MPTRLNCLIQDKKIIDRIKISLNNIANSMIAKNANVKVTAKDLYNKLKSVGIDIDLESTAALYSEAFATSIGVHSNFETYDELNAYKTQSVNLSNYAKESLIKGGFGKTLKNGKVILDWVKLMRKEQSEIIDEITKSITDSFPKGTQQSIIDAEVIKTLDGLKSEWKQIISNAVIKSQNILRKKDEQVTVSQKNAVDKLSDLYAEGLVSTFKDDYENALRKAVGVNAKNLSAMQQLDNLGKVSNLMSQSAYGTNNHLGTILQHQANEIVNKAKFEDANFVYKAAKTVKGLYDFILLKILNNPFNRSENYISGASGSLFTAATYGMPEKEIRQLRDAVKKDIIRNGGGDYGEVSNALVGDRKSIDNVRKKINELVTGNEQNKVGNWIYAQTMGTAALNAVDSYRKVSNTWARFVSGMESVLISKGMSKEDAQKRLHEELFGDGRWDEAFKKAEKFIQEANTKGGFQIQTDKQTAQRFAADIIKLELVESKLITADELNASWNAAYKSAGREMGHVANNIITYGVTKLKEGIGKNIDDAVRNNDYTKAGIYMFVDVILNKMALKFIGGGTNWVVLKLEKGGLGIISGAIGRGIHKTSYSNKKNLSTLTAKEIEQSLYDIQKTNDKFTRGTIGLLTNSLFLLTAKLAIDGLGNDDDEKKRRRKKVTEWLDKHYLVQKAINKIGFLYISAFMAKMQQDNISWNDLDSKYKKQPFVAYSQNLFNANPDYTLLNQAMASLPYFTNAMTEDEYNNQENEKGNIIRHRVSYEEYLEKESEKQKYGAVAFGKIMSNYFDLNPLPTQMLKGGVDIYKEILGTTEEYETPKFDSKSDALKAGYFKSGIFDGKFDKKVGEK